MPFSPIGAYACQNLQVSLVDYFGRNAPQYRTLGDTALIKWLLSPQNTAGFQRISVTSVAGKKRGVAFLVEQPYCFELCSIARDCNTPPELYEPQAQEIVFTLDDDPWRHCDTNGDPQALKFDYEDLMKYCTMNDQTWITNQINRYLLRWEQALDKVIWTELMTHIGTDIKGAKPTNIPIFYQNALMNTAALNPEGIWYVEQVMKDTGNDQQFAIIGGTEVTKLSKFAGWSGLNAAGIDLSNVSDSVPYLFYDRNADAALGVNDFLELSTGAVQLVTWNKYAGSMGKSVTDLYTHGTITLPTTGLTVDYEWTYDYKCHVWTFEAFLYIELAVVPAGGCGAAAATVNGILQVHDCGGLPAIPTCPTP